MSKENFIDTEALSLKLLDMIGKGDCLFEFSKIIACFFHADAISILECNGSKLLPVSLLGISKETFGRRFDLDENPRLKLVAAHDNATIFADDIDLPDPFDGLIDDKHERLEVHSCSGIPIKQNGRLRGIITLDSLDLGVFSRFPKDNFDTATFIVAKIVLQALNNYNLAEQLSNKTLLNQTLIEASKAKSNDMIGKSAQIEHLKKEIEIVAPSDLAVLITGETGVGKEVVAHTIHSASKRFDKPLIYVNCAALPESIAESELFGHVKGAFTGAISNRSGKFELANGGTLFLDEIGELPLVIQAKLLRAIQSGDIQRVGSDRHIQVNVRVIAATNRDLPVEVEQGSFREDLYHRLSVYPICIPPLRDRISDLELLIGFFIERNRVKLGLQSIRLDKNILNLFSGYAWPGNVRELEHVISRGMLRAASRSGRIVTLQPDDIDSAISSPKIKISESSTALALENIDWCDEPKSFTLLIDDYKRTVIQQALNDCQGNWNKTAELLSLDKGNIHRLGKRLGLK